ncbi:hypothetical protein HPB52_014646 [Rhipicephalus sanguineus]|uniref:Tick transposon n=1 Tax=Rhipicephalus sanguineus TaxID=34632 RepID=A0A9D4SZA1_RHISA|nr:hypothetical protein HPB52_014646 [Rhipicephalus sanguineus]
MLDFLQVVPKLIGRVNHIDGPKLLNAESKHGSSQVEAQSREIAINAPPQRDRSNARAQDAVTGEQICILNEHLNQLHTALTKRRQFDRVVDYNDRATATSAKLKYRIRQFQVSQNRALPPTPTELVQCTHQPAIQLPKIDLVKFDGQRSLWTPFWEHFNQLIHNNGGLTDVDRLTCSDSSTCNPFDPPNDLRGLRCLYDMVQYQTSAIRTLGSSTSTRPSHAKVQSKEDKMEAQANKDSTEEQTARIQSLLFFIRTEIEARERTVLHVSVKEDTSKSQVDDFRSSASSAILFSPSAFNQSANPVPQENACFFCDSTIHYREQCDTPIPLEKRRNAY